MRAGERREAILKRLAQSDSPISATTLAHEYDVSRQIVVGDVALLRAAGKQIAATPRGYVYIQNHSGLIRQVAVLHSAAQTEEELTICVDHGCTVLDVVVEHPVYGQLTGQLQLASRYDVHLFMERMRKESGHSLSELTDGIHLHTLRCPNEDAYRHTCQALDEAGILLKDPL